MSDGTIVVTGFANCEEANHEFQQFGFNYGELSDEYTTGALIADTIAALPPYPGTFDGSCSASRNLSNDESCYSIQRFRYKFTYPLTLNPFVIHWVEKFIPDNGGPVVTKSRCEPVSKHTTESSIHELLEPASNGTITVEQISIETFDAENDTSITPVPASSPFMTPPPCQWGATTTEGLHIDISACSDGVKWHAIVTALKGDYSTQARLMPGWDSNPPTQQVTGIGGNTTPQYFCQQVTQLDDLVLTYCPAAWYMLEAVEAHEHFHVTTLLPFLKDAADGIVNQAQQLSVPDSGQSQQEAISQIQDLPDFLLWPSATRFLLGACHTRIRQRRMTNPAGRRSKKSVT